MARVHFRYDYSGLIASAVLYNNRLRRPGMVPFLVDTGAAKTMLSPDAQLDLGIDPERMGLRRYERTITTIAGNVIAHKLPDCLLCLLPEDGREGPINLEVGELLLTEGISRGRAGKGPGTRIGPIPSLLGRDVLEAHGLTLSVDFGKRAAYLETP